MKQSYHGWVPKSLADFPLCSSRRSARPSNRGYFSRKLLGVSSADSAHLFAMLQGHVTRLENTVRWRWSAGDVAIWDNRATQHKAIDDYGDQRRIVRRVTIEGPVSVGIDGRHGTRRGGPIQVTAAE